MFDACSCVLPLGKTYDNRTSGWTVAPAQGMDEMDNMLNGKTQIWADGYSFMEVTETLLMALGIRTEDCQPSESELSPAERTLPSDATCGAEADR